MTETMDRIIDLAAQGYCCSQLLLQLALDLHGGDNPDLIRANGALCRGHGSSEGVCGLLQGGNLVLGLYLAGPPNNWSHEYFATALTEFNEWFAQQNETRSGITCAAIQGGPSTSPADFGRCRYLLTMVWNKLYELLTASGLDLTIPPGEHTF